jgi:zinc-binding alcohol dehydrogenase/oxidoreductase
MRAVVLSENGGPEKLTIEEVTTPQPKAGEVRVKLKTSALNRRDYYLTLGLYPGMQYPSIPGSDGAGVVDAVGEGGDASLIGNEVVIYPARDWGDDETKFGPNFFALGMPDQGTFAEYVCVPAGNIFAKPAHLNWEQAAAIPLAGLTSWRAVVTHAEVQAGQKVLVTGAGSGVSTFAIHWALGLGAEVYVTSGNTEKINKAKALGVSDGVSYLEEGFTDQLREMSGGFDVIIDSAGGDGINALINTLNDAGRYVFFGSTLGDPSVGLQLVSLFFRHIRLQGTTMGSPKEFGAMINFVRDKKIEPTVHEVFPMEEVISAFKLMENFSQVGKIVMSNQQDN